MKQVSLQIATRTRRGVVDPMVCEACVRRSVEQVTGSEPDVAVDATGHMNVQVDYDPARTSPGRIRAALRCWNDQPATAAKDGQLEATCRFVHLPGMRSGRSQRAVERRLNRMPGVEAQASFAAGGVSIHLEPPATLEPVLEALRQIGFKPQAPAAARPAATFRDALRYVAAHRDLWLVLTGGLLLLAGWGVYLLDGPVALRLVLLAASVVCTSTRTLPGAIDALRAFKLDVDVLMFVAAGGAAVLGHYEEGAFLLFLFGLGAAGEHLALGHARDAIRSLSTIAPETAHRLGDDGSVREVPVESLVVGDVVVVRPFGRVPIDGQIIEGTSQLDQSAITGESMPVTRTVGEAVFAGTVNTTDQLTVQCTAASGQTMLARIVELVEQAQTNRSPTQQFTERIETWYVPMVFAATLMLAILPPWLADGSWATWFYRSMAFLTAASPCALAIGTPAAVLCGIAHAARMGVLFKGGAHLDTLGRVTTMCFDKTGTLTIGKPTVQAVETAPGTDEATLFHLAAAVESQVHHPLADAIVQHATAHPRNGTAASATQVRQSAGRGATGVVDGQLVEVGKPARVGEADETRWWHDAVDRLSASGMTVAAVAVDGRVLGVIGLADELRAESREVLASLHRLGVTKVAMLTGDHEAAAKRIGEAAGLDAVFAGLLPAEKLTHIDRLKSPGRPVAMVGDGVNDAPALAQADIGIAIGAAGADVAIDTADVVLMGADLHRLPDAVALAQRSRRIISQNLLIAMGVIAVVAPLGALGFAHLGTAVLLHEGSTIVVVLNALRLLRGR